MAGTDEGGAAGVAGTDEGGAAGAAGTTEALRDAEATKLLEELQARAAAAGATSQPWGELSLDDGPLVSGFGCPGMPLSESEQATIARIGRCGPTLGGPPYVSTAHLLVEATAAMLEPWGTSSRWQFILDAVGEMGEAYWAYTNELAVFPPVGELSCSSGAGRTVLVEPYAALDDPFFVQASLALSEWSPHGDSAALLALADALADSAAAVDDGGYFAEVTVILGSRPDACPETMEEAQLVSAIEALRDAGLWSLAVIDLDSGYDVDRIADAGQTYPFHISSDDDPARLTEAILKSRSFPLDGLFQNGESALSVLASSAPESTVLVSYGQDFIPQLPSAAACATSRYGGWYAAVGADGAETVHLCPCTTQLSGGIDPLAPCDFYPGLERYP